MNKKGVLVSLLVICILSIFLINPFVKADSLDYSLNISVNILPIIVPTLRVEISPNNINLGNVRPGENGNYSNITFINKGELKAIIYPTLTINADPVFNYLEFQTTSCSPSSSWHNFGYYNSTDPLISLSKPSSGEETMDSACIRLGLKNYSGPTISPGLKSTQVTFLVMSDG
jgi:hypothetical protein